MGDKEWFGVRARDKEWRHQRIQMGGVILEFWKNLGDTMGNS